MMFSKKPIRPALIVLVLCGLVFAWKWGQLVSMRREVAAALSELKEGKPMLSMDGFINEYLADPFGKAIGMNKRQLELCQQVSARVPSYERAIAWRNDAAFIGLVTLGYLLLKRYRARLPIERWRGALRASMQRLAVRMAPLMAEARRRAQEKRYGRAAAGSASSTGAANSSGTVYDIVACPHCGQKLRLPTGRGTLRVKCAGCHTVFECRT